MAFKYIEWYSLAEGLRDYLANFTYDDGRHLFNYINNYDNLKINVGTGNTGEYPSINILFGEEDDLSDRPNTDNGAIVQLWIDISISGTQSSDTMTSTSDTYKQLFLVEKELFIALNGYNKLMRRTLGIATNLKVRGILSDGDGNLPVCLQHRIVIEIDWRKSD